jgi:tRNA G26 N,N-dimethylase Trm1
MVMREGGISLLESDTFYSLFQKVHRDATILILKYILCSCNLSGDANLQLPLRYLDLFCGNGVRSLRFLKEVGGEYEGTVEIVGIDSQQDCVKVANDTAVLNNLHDNAHFMQHKVTTTGQLPCCLDQFDCIDVDPFGSSIPYIEQCLPLLRDKGLLLLTCTDSRELFLGKGSGRGNQQTSGGFITSGVLRPPPSLAPHEFGLRAVVTAACLAVRRQNRYPAVLACWVFPHGCRLIIRVTESPPLPCLARRDVMSRVVESKAAVYTIPEDTALSGGGAGGGVGAAWRLPLSHVHFSEARSIALVGAGPDECDDGSRGRSALLGSNDQALGGGWSRGGPLWAAATADVSLIQGVIRTNTSPVPEEKTEGVCESDQTTICDIVYPASASALLLLNRILEENSIFMHTSEHIYNEAGLQLTYTWGVYSAQGLVSAVLSSTSNNKPRESPSIREMGRCLAGGLVRSAVAIQEDHRHFKVTATLTCFCNCSAACMQALPRLHYL